MWKISAISTTWQSKVPVAYVSVSKEIKESWLYLRNNPVNT